MVRTPKKVDLKLLKKIIKEAEESRLFSNRSELYENVANQYNSRLRDIRMGATLEKMIEDTFPDISPSIVNLRIQEYNIVIRTPKGQRGRKKGQKMGSSGEPRKRVSRATKFASNPLMIKALQELRKEFPEKQKWVDEVEKNGSLIYAVRLHCFACGGHDNYESRHCSAINCALFCFLPRKIEK